jgi:hypothetical protein
MTSEVHKRRHWQKADYYLQNTDTTDLSVAIASETTCRYQKLESKGSSGPHFSRGVDVWIGYMALIRRSRDEKLWRDLASIRANLRENGRVVRVIVL